MHIQRFFETFYPVGNVKVKYVGDFIKLTPKWFYNNDEAGESAAEVLYDNAALNDDEYDFTRICKCIDLRHKFALWVYFNGDDGQPNWNRMGTFDSKEDAKIEVERWALENNVAVTPDIDKSGYRILKYNISFVDNKGVFQCVTIDRGNDFGKIQEFTIYPLNEQYFFKPTLKEIALFNKLFTSGIHAKTSRFDL